MFAVRYTANNGGQITVPITGVATAEEAALAATRWVPLSANEVEVWTITGPPEVFQIGLLPKDPEAA